ncbi:hypothetical protein BH11BAC4_BH11BAC4_02860 [soil metagenome]
MKQIACLNATVRNLSKALLSKNESVSAQSKEPDIKKGYDLGASLYITKPFSIRELLKQIKELLEN